MDNDRNWQSVESTRIRAVDYDPASRTLYIKFPPNRNGDLAMYAYANVEPKVFAAFQAAPSKGKFFETIKNNKDEYPYQRIGTEREEEKEAE